MLVPAVIATPLGSGRGTGMVLARIAGPPHLAGHLGETGHRGGQIQLAVRHGATEVAGLSDPQLRQAGQSVLRLHP